MTRRVEAFVIAGLALCYGVVGATLLMILG